MAVRIRMVRIGKKNFPFFRIGIYESHTRRNGHCLENLGWMNPLTNVPEKQLSINLARTKHWLSMGAQPTPKTRILLKKAGVFLPERPTLQN